jgi:hypothetical protein
LRFARQMVPAAITSTLHVFAIAHHSMLSSWFQCRNGWRKVISSHVPVQFFNHFVLHSKWGIVGDFLTGFFTVGVFGKQIWDVSIPPQSHTVLCSAIPAIMAHVQTVRDKKFYSASLSFVELVSLLILGALSCSPCFPT